MPRDPTRRPALDGLRGLAAVAIVVHHAWQFSGHPVAPLGIWWNGLALGVPLFFCLSGFLVYAPWARAAIDRTARVPELGRFYALRAARILPLYWLTLGVAVLLLHGTGHWRSLEGWRLLQLVVLAQNLSPETAGMVNPPAWSLAVEVAFYALVPLIGLLALRLLRGWGPGVTGTAASPEPRGPGAPTRLGGRRRPDAGRAAHVLLLVGLTGASLAWSARSAAPVPTPAVRTVLPDVLGLFCVGMAARVLVEGREVPRWVARALLAAGAALVWAHGSGTLGAPLAGLLGDLPAAVGFAAICVACAAPGAPRPLGCRPLAALGTWSFGIYLWHYPLLMGLQVRGLLPYEEVWATSAVVGALAVLLAAISHRLVEQPLLRAARRRLDRARGGVSAPAGTPRVAGRVGLPA